MIIGSLLRRAFSIMIKSTPYTTSAAETTQALYSQPSMSRPVSLSITLSSTSPTMAAGMLATTTLNQMAQVSFFLGSFFLGVKGLSLVKNITTTARIAPSCITTSNISQNSPAKSGPSSAPTFSPRNSLRSIRCPVELIGSHSVTPSTIPYSIAFRISVITSSLSEQDNQWCRPPFSAAFQGTSCQFL